ncbi:MAG: response regulator [Oscillospiraceae bacterium]|nr:response regulator [Oscillospiraceae bacterium]
MADNTRRLMPNGKVLVVDDTEQNLCVASELMKLYRLQIETAGGGLEAVQKVERGNSYDIIFMDHLMPETDGVEATAMIRKTGYNRAIIVLTADEHDDDSDFLKQNGFDGYLAKPINISKLDVILNRYIVADDAKTSEELKSDSEDSPNSDEMKTVLLNGIEGLDVEKGIQKYEGDVSAYFRILRSFSINSLPMLEAMAVIDPNDLKSYEIKVHGFKGMSYDIFANEAGDKAKSLEFAAKDGNLSFITENNPNFIETARTLVANVGKMVESINALTTKPQRKKPDEGLLKKLADACRVYDMTEADSIMDEINKYCYTDDDGLTEWLSQKVEMVEYKTVVSRINGLFDGL